MARLLLAARTANTIDNVIITSPNTIAPKIIPYLTLELAHIPFVLDSALSTILLFAGSFSALAFVVVPVAAAAVVLPEVVDGADPVVVDSCPEVVPAVVPETAPVVVVEEVEPEVLDVVVVVAFPVVAAAAVVVVEVAAVDDVDVVPFFEVVPLCDVVPLLIEVLLLEAVDVKEDVAAEVTEAAVVAMEEVTVETVAKENKKEKKFGKCGRPDEVCMNNFDKTRYRSLLF